MNRPHPTPWRIPAHDNNDENIVRRIDDAEGRPVVSTFLGIDRRAAEYLIAAVNGRDDLEAELRAARAAFQGLQAAATKEAS